MAARPPTHRKYSWHTLFYTAIPIQVTLIFAGAGFFLPGGEDLHRFYRPLAEGCVVCAYNPWYTHWLLLPLAWTPPHLLWPFWSLATGLILTVISRYLGTNPSAVLLAFPMMGLVWLGQVDALVALGLALALLSPNVFMRGGGLLLASIKPHVAGLAILVLLWHEKDHLKTLIVPGIVLAASFFVWGINWPARWLTPQEQFFMPVWGQASLYPYALAVLPAVLLGRDKREQATIALVVSALAVPRFGVYSYVTFLPFAAPWWAVPVSYLWVVAYPWLGNQAMQFAWVLPLALLFYLTIPAARERWPALRVRFARSQDERHKKPLPRQESPEQTEAL